MASRRLISSLLRSSVRRSFSKGATPNPRSPARPVPAGFLLNRAIDFATSAASQTPAPDPVRTPTKSQGPSGKITDDFTGAGSIGHVCQVIGAVVDVRFVEGLPPILTALEVLDNSIRLFSTASDNIIYQLVKCIQLGITFSSFGSIC